MDTNDRIGTTPTMDTRFANKVPLSGKASSRVGSCRNGVKGQRFSQKTAKANQGSRVFVADREGVFTDGPNNLLAITNNSFGNITPPDAMSISSDDLADVCANVSGNTKSDGGPPDGHIFLERRVAGAGFNVPQASTAANATDNNGSTVTTGAQLLTFNTPCNPPSPSNP